MNDIKNSAISQIRAMCAVARNTISRGVDISRLTIWAKRESAARRFIENSATQADIDNLQLEVDRRGVLNETVSDLARKIIVDADKMLSFAYKIEGLQSKAEREVIYAQDDDSETINQAVISLNNSLQSLWPSI